MNPWIIVALLIIVALAGYAAWLHWLLWQRKGTARNTASSHQAGAAAVGTFDPATAAAPRRTVMAEKAVYLLAEAILDDKLTHTEGCIRISSVAAGLTDYDRFRDEFSVFFQVAEATAHIPILDDWRALSLQEKKAFDQERKAIEARYSEAVVDAAQRLRAR